MEFRLCITVAEFRSLFQAWLLGGRLERLSGTQSFGVCLQIEVEIELLGWRRDASQEVGPSGPVKVLLG